MKINSFTAILVFLLAAIVSYFLSSYQAENNRLILVIGSFLGLFISGLAAISLTFQYDKTTTLTRTTASLFFILYLISQIFFALTIFVLPTYVLISGSIIILMLLVIYGISKANY